MMQNIYAIALLAACFTSVVYADTDKIVKPDLPSDIHSNAVENLSQQWGMAAIKIPSQNLQIEKDSAEWSAAISSEYKLTNDTASEQSFYTIQNFQPLNGINAAYNNGRFRAETGLLTNSTDVMDSGKFYLQGSFSIYNKEKFDIAVTAKFEAVDNPFFNAYIGEVEPIIDAQTIFEHQSKNATIGVITTYSINKQWKVLGSITTTTYEQALQNSPLVDINNSHMALFGTSYSF